MTIEGEVVSWADRIAYCAHDLEGAIHAGIVTAAEIPAEVAEVGGRTRREQLRTFVHAVIRAVDRYGEVGMEPAEASALSALRAFNYERIYVRPASLAQSQAVVAVLRALVEFYLDHPQSMPTVSAFEIPMKDRVRAAVAYVAGMTDRYAFDRAVAELGWDPSRLPPAS
jgi:dGTPase